MKKKNLTILQRIIASVIYTGVFVSACYFFSGDWSFLFDASNSYNVMFISGALLLVMGTYIAEPFFTKPTDVLTNSIAIILALLSINDKSGFIGYWYLMYASLTLTIGSVILFFLYYFPKTRTLQKISTEILTKFGQSKVIFSVIYIASLFSFFSDKPIDFSFFITFWIIFITNFVVEDSILWIGKLVRLTKIKNLDLLGEAIGCENPFLYKVEIDYFKHRTRDTKKGELVYLSTEDRCGYVGIIVEEKYLLNKKWVSIYLLQKDNLPVKINLKNNEIVESSKSIFSADNFVYSLDIDSLDNPASKDQILQNSLYKQRNSFVGYVSKGSNIHKLKFVTLVDPSNTNHKLLKEGSVIRTKIINENVLYQIIDGETIEEELDKHNIYGYLSGTAHKLGIYKKNEKELAVAKWLPNIYSPIFFDSSRPGEQDQLKIGNLPETNLEIVIKNIDSLVTHNTAILGILGIGKSCLTFELIQKTVNNTDTKVICIDITGEYNNPDKGLSNYIDISLIEVGVEKINSELSKKDITLEDSKYDGGNINPFKEVIKTNIAEFLVNQDKRIKIINPEEIRVIQQSENAKNRNKGGTWEMYAAFSELTPTETTRVISEACLELAKESGMSDKSKLLIVYEEAHSLIPEWNSVANDGDKKATNGISKVILQGRKYGLGAFIVTQRTASVSKSALNQCNTVFALRVFDDTGKQFLENYIGSDYANTLPTLDERHAVVVGKALKLKQPVIIRLNEKDEVVLTR